MIAGFLDKQLAYSLYINAVVISCEQGGISRQTLFRGTGLFDDTLHRDTLVSASQLIRLLENVVRLRRQPDSGFMIGHQLAALSHHSHVGYLHHSKNGEQWVRSAQILAAEIMPLLRVRRYATTDADYFVFSGLQLDTHRLTLDTHGNSTLVSHRYKMNNHYQSILLESVFTALAVLIKQWLGTRLPLEFLFAGPTPANLPDYQTHLGAKVHFGHGFNGIRVTRGLLQKHGKAGNSLYLLTLIKMARRERKPAILLPQAVRGLLYTNSEMTLSDAANALQMSPATLKRRLKEFGLTFRQISDSLRREQAVFLLQYSGFNNQQSALKMAIGDLTNFRRAVKRWTGLTPSQLRQRRQI